MQDRLLKRRDVQVRLSIGHTKFFALVKAGRLRAVMLDGQLRISEEDLRAFEATLPSARAAASEAGDAL